MCWSLGKGDGTFVPELRPSPCSEGVALLQRIGFAARFLLGSCRSLLSFLILTGH